MTKSYNMRQPESMKSITIFHTEWLWSPTRHFDHLHFFQRPSWRIKLPGCCKVKVKEREISRSWRSKDKAQGHFAILMVRKVQFLQFMAYLLSFEVNWPEKNIKLLTKFENTSTTYCFNKWQAINLVKACL